MLIVRILIMLLIAFLAGAVWVIWNVQANLTVVNAYIHQGSVMWYAGAAMSVLLSVGLLALHLMQKFKGQMPGENVLPFPRALLIAFGVLTTLIDIPLPSYGVWLDSGWPTSPAIYGIPVYAILAFFLGGVIGSTVSQWVLVEALIDIWNVVSYLLKDNGATPKKSVIDNAKMPAASPVYNRENRAQVSRKRAEQKPQKQQEQRRDRDIDFSLVEEDPFMR